MQRYEFFIAATSPGHSAPHSDASRFIIDTDRGSVDAYVIHEGFERFGHARNATALLVFPDDFTRVFLLFSRGY